MSSINSWTRPDAAQAYNRDFDVYRVRHVFPDIWQRLVIENQSSPIRKIIDYGCGGGLFFQNIPCKLQDVDFIGYDISDSMLKEARATCAIIQHARISITDDIRSQTPGTFDAVVCNAVWINWPTQEMCVGNLRSIQQLLKPNGVAFFTMTHPLHRDVDPEYEHHFDMKNYNTPGLPFEVSRRGDTSGASNIINYHWPLEVMNQQLKGAGFHQGGIFDSYPPATSDIAFGHWLRVTVRKIATPTP